MVSSFRSRHRAPAKRAEDPMPTSIRSMMLKRLNQGHRWFEWAETNDGSGGGGRPK